ncbi:hypothetical protein Tco_0238026 [Tanacetum coccineum]
MVQKPRSKRTRFGGDGVAVEFGGGGCGGEVAGRVAVAAAEDDDDGAVGQAARRGSGVDGGVVVMECRICGGSCGGYDVECGDGGAAWSGSEGDMVVEMKMMLRG